MEGESNIKKRKRYRSSSLTPATFSGDEEIETRFGMLFDIDLLNCPICYEGFAVAGPIFQCDNGHLACSSCCTKLKNKCCPSCTLPIGNIRSRAMENMVESIVFRCPNFKFGCKEVLSNEDHKTHGKKCRFHQCFCPLPNCDFKGTYKDLFQHFDATHKDSPIPFVKLCPLSMHISEKRCVLTKLSVSMHISEKMCVLMETTDSLLFVLQCFEKPDFISVVVKCIAPLSDEVGEFSYNLYFSNGEVTLNSGFSTMKKVQEVKFETPDTNFMLIPSYLIRRTLGKLEVMVVIQKKKDVMTI